MTQTRSSVRVLFLSTGNAARSPIAESILLSLMGGDGAAASAGVIPLQHIHPLARLSVQNVFNGRIAHQRPRTVTECLNERFDYVFTLSQEAADRCPTLPDNPQRIHWPLDDPAAAQGTRDQRQLAFDRVTRELLRRLRRWWRSPEVSGLPLDLSKRRGWRPKQAQWRTHPEGDAPLLVVAYFGGMRRCRNMCALFERSGYRVLCGDQYGRRPRALGVVPDGLVVRVDGPRTGSLVRPEFQALADLRLAFDTVPILILGAGIISDGERQLVEKSGARFMLRTRQAGGLLFTALAEMVSPSRRS